jgi:hypothetical protein
MKDIFCYEMMRGGWRGEREEEDREFRADRARSEGI